MLPGENPLDRPKGISQQLRKSGETLADADIEVIFTTPMTNSSNCTVSPPSHLPKNRPQMRRKDLTHARNQMKTNGLVQFERFFEFSPKMRRAQPKTSPVGPASAGYPNARSPGSRLLQTLSANLQCSEPDPVDPRYFGRWRRVYTRQTNVPGSKISSGVEP